MSRSIWAEWQREQARRQRLLQQERRATDREAARGIREEQQVRRADDRRGVAELDSVLVAGVRLRPDVTFASLKRAVTL